MKKESYEIDWNPEQSKTNKQAGQSYSSTSGFLQVGAMQGWQCPVCKRVLSPWTVECPCKGQINYDTVITSIGPSQTINLNNDLKDYDFNNHIPHIDTYYTESGTK